MNNPKPEEIAIVLSPEQSQVREDVRAGRNILVTGAAGTGKSFLLKLINEDSAGTLGICASTGIAALGVGGMTIHSWAGVGIADKPAKQIAENLLSRKNEAYSRITRYKRLAIDEVSMIGSHLFTVLDHVFRLVRNEPQAPFGGMQIILFGDFLQLPPVGQAEDGTRFCFESPSWNEARIKVSMLTKVFRQEDAAFSSALNDLRTGTITPAARALLNSRHHRYVKDLRDPNPEIRAVIVHTHNADVDTINRDILRKLLGETKKFHAIDTGREPQLATLQKNCLAPAELALKVGAQVMLLKNLDPLGGLANGSIGIVTGFAKFGGMPMVKFTNGKISTLEPEEWSIKDGEICMATRQQVPLRLAWAITSHKCQGMTLDKIEVHLENVFEDGQAYVALSRAKTLEGLFIRSGGRASIRANSDAVEFYRRALAGEEPTPAKEFQLV